MPAQENAAERRARWVSYLDTLTGSFEENSQKVVDELRTEATIGPAAVLIDHLRLCGAVPERYDPDSTQEKLYSKYTDAVVSETFSTMGLNSVVIGARADSADVQARGGRVFVSGRRKGFSSQPNRQESEGFQNSGVGRLAGRFRLRSSRLPDIPDADEIESNLLPSDRPERLYYELLPPSSARSPYATSRRNTGWNSVS